MAENHNEQDYEVIEVNDDALSPADALDHEAPQPDTTKGRVFKVNHEGTEFLIADFIKGRRWRDVEYTLAALNGEMGVAAVGDAVMEVLGNEQGKKTVDWDYYQFMGFGEKVGKVIEAMIGKTGKSRR